MKSVAKRRQLNLPPIRHRTLPWKQRRSRKKVVNLGPVQYVAEAVDTNLLCNDAAQVCVQPSLNNSVDERKLELEIDSTMKIERYCFLWLTGWSSWIYILHFIGFVNVFIIQHKESKDICVLNKFYTIGGWTTEQLSVWMSQNLDADPLCVFEGTQKDIKEWMDQIRTLPLDRASVCLLFKDRVRSYRGFNGFSWKRLHHFKDCGGATTTTYQIAVNNKLNSCWRAIECKEAQWELDDFVNVANGVIIVYQ